VGRPWNLLMLTLVVHIMTTGLQNVSVLIWCAAFIINTHLSLFVRTFTSYCSIQFRNCKLSSIFNMAYGRHVTLTTAVTSKQNNKMDARSLCGTEAGSVPANILFIFLILLSACLWDTTDTYVHRTQYSQENGRRIAQLKCQFIQQTQAFWHVTRVY
jgi:hypothetical protein